jgi:flavorubredoxin
LWHPEEEGIEMPTLTKTRLTPSRVANETFVIHDHQGEGTAPVSVALNAMVIRAAEPVVVDTGVAANRDEFLADVFSLVEPYDIRWVFLSHDDVDHTGNVNTLMEAAPNATLVVNWFITERMGGALAVSPARQRWVGDGEHFDVGDRRLYAVRPPVFDSPTTRGLFDPTTGVYWASDAFATPMPVPVTDADQLDEDFWNGGVLMFARYLSPWLELIDETKFQRSVSRVASLGATTIAGCHTPVVQSYHLDRVIDITRRAPGAHVPPEPGQTVLEEIQRVLAV